MHRSRQNKEWWSSSPSVSFSILLLLLPMRLSSLYSSHLYYCQDPKLLTLRSVCLLRILYASRPSPLLLSWGIDSNGIRALLREMGLQPVDCQNVPPPHCQHAPSFLPTNTENAGSHHEFLATIIFSRSCDQNGFASLFFPTRTFQNEWVSVSAPTVHPSCYLL